jgi:hypothetical protein
VPADPSDLEVIGNEVLVTSAGLDDVFVFVANTGGQPSNPGGDGGGSSPGTGGDGGSQPGVPGGDGSHPVGGVPLSGAPSPLHEPLQLPPSPTSGSVSVVAATPGTPLGAVVVLVANPSPTDDETGDSSPALSSLIGGDAGVPIDSVPSATEAETGGIDLEERLRRLDLYERPDDADEVPPPQANPDWSSPPESPRPERAVVPPVLARIAADFAPSPEAVRRAIEVSRVAAADAVFRSAEGNETGRQWMSLMLAGVGLNPLQVPASYRSRKRRPLARGEQQDAHD